MEKLIVLLPLLGALFAGLFGRTLGVRAVNLLTCGLMLIVTALACHTFVDVAFNQNARTVPLFTWIAAGNLNVSWALRLDTLSAVMLVVVSSVSTMVHIYAVGYMSHDHSRQRFMAYLSLFTFMMLMLVTADNFVQLFFGWEGVGLASYLLIGFWYHKDSANQASMKAFLVNRVGDLGLALGIFAVFQVFGSLDFSSVFAAAGEHSQTMLSFWGMELPALETICILLFIGAVGKSAQFGLHTWLPDAMEGPTPVSALIHAATMVTAGVFLLCRISPMLEFAPLAKDVVVALGAFTALFAASVGLVQNDIKRVIAYSTCSQLGYMVFAAGLGAYGAAMFHLFTHAFFKALLFLCAGSVIHGLHDEQDLRRMGGLRRKMPVTFALMLVGSLALAGIPPLAGYYSKDMILEAAFASKSAFAPFAFQIGELVAFLTAFYSFRLFVMTFHGKPRGDHHAYDHAHESPTIMLIPLFVLAIGAVGAGYIGYDSFIGDGRFDFWNGSLFTSHHDVIHAAHGVPAWVKKAPLVAGILGIFLAYVLYMGTGAIPKRLAKAFAPVHQFLLNRWYIDVAYYNVFVRPALALGQVFWKGGDGAIINRFGPDGAAWLTGISSRGLSRLHSGYVYHYAFAMLLAVTLAVTAFWGKM